MASRQREPLVPPGLAGNPCAQLRRLERRRHSARSSYAGRLSPRYPGVSSGQSQPGHPSGPRVVPRARVHRWWDAGRRELRRWRLDPVCLELLQEPSDPSAQAGGTSRGVRGRFAWRVIGGAVAAHLRQMPARFCATATQFRAPRSRSWAAGTRGRAVAAQRCASQGSTRQSRPAQVSNALKMAAYFGTRRWQSNQFLSVSAALNGQ